jgi:hypothetical protein
LFNWKNLAKSLLKIGSSQTLKFENGHFFLDKIVARLNLPLAILLALYMQTLNPLPCVVSLEMTISQIVTCPNPNFNLLVP